MLRPPKRGGEQGIGLPVQCRRHRNRAERIAPRKCDIHVERGQLQQCPEAALKRANGRVLVAQTDIAPDDILTQPIQRTDDYFALAQMRAAMERQMRVPGDAFFGRQEHAVGLEIAQASAGLTEQFGKLAQIGVTPQVIRQ